MKSVLNIYKPPGKTPLETIELFREKNPEYKGVKMSYAGRLDPLAEGVLLVAAGKGIEKREQLMGLDKEYEAQVLLGFNTDTYDILGIAKATKNKDAPENKIKETLKSFEGKHSFPLPPYSGYKVKGKKLFWWAKQGKLGKIDIPKKEMVFEKIGLSSIKSMPSADLLKEINERVGRVKGDFRQESILGRWESVLSEDNREYEIAKITTHTQSGAYVRSLTHYFGLQLKTGATLFSLKRTRVGPYKITESLRV